MTPDFVVEKLLEKMGEDEKHYGIEWQEMINGDFFAIVSGVHLRLYNRNFEISLDFSSGSECARINEPKIHISQAPIGKFWRKICLFLGLKPPAAEPISSQARENERLRVNLNALYSRAATQCAARLEPDAMEKSAQILFPKVTETREILH